MGLNVRDAISATSIKAYDAFMASVANTSFLSLEHKDDTIVVYEHEGTNDAVIRAGRFGASGLAARYFEQEEKAAKEMGMV
jgi:hypothetical protein